MPQDAPPLDPVSEFAKELAKQLPIKSVYDDAAKPAAKETGQLLSDTIKVVALALAPIQYLAALQDRYRSFLDRSVRRVPEDRRVAPAPQIIGPVLEGIRYEPDDTPIIEMFSELLSRSMDKERVNEAHPAFPILIGQLSADEAKIIARLKDQQYNYVYTSDYDRNKNLFSGRKVEIDDFPRENLAFPENISFYFDHMTHLGIAGIYQNGNQEPLNSQGIQVGTRVRCKYRLTDFGYRFAHACTSSGAK